MKFTNSLNCRTMIHPGKKLIEEIRNRNWTQKQFAVFVGKKNSEVNELIKGKRNITIQWDLILSEVFGTPEKYWINMQTDYDYEIAKKEREKQKMEQKQDFEVVTDIESNDEKKEEKESTQKTEGVIIKEQENTSISPNCLESLPDQTETEDNSIIKKPQEESNKPIEKEYNDEEIQKKKEIGKIFMNF